MAGEIRIEGRVQAFCDADMTDVDLMDSFDELMGESYTQEELDAAICGLYEVGDNALDDPIYDRINARMESLYDFDAAAAVGELEYDPLVEEVPLVVIGENKDVDLDSIDYDACGFI